MKKFALQVVGLLLLIFVGLMLSVNPNSLTNVPIPGVRGIPTPAPSAVNLDVGVLSIMDQQGQEKARLNIEVADDPEERRQGLSDRPSLPVDSGMLFVFDQPYVPTFWMKNVSFPLDFVWINGQTIVDLRSNVPPAEPGVADEDLPRYAPQVPVDMVLEVNGGYIEGKGIKVGDKIVIQ